MEQTGNEEEQKKKKKSPAQKNGKNRSKKHIQRDLEAGDGKRVLPPSQGTSIVGLKDSRVGNGLKLTINAGTEGPRLHLPTNASAVDQKKALTYQRVENQQIQGISNTRTITAVDGGSVGDNATVTINASHRAGSLTRSDREAVPVVPTEKEYRKKQAKVPVTEMKKNMAIKNEKNTESRAKPPARFETNFHSHASNGQSNAKKKPQQKDEEQKNNGSAKTHNMKGILKIEAYKEDSLESKKNKTIDGYKKGKMLIESVRKGEFEIVSHLIDIGAYVDYRDMAEGYTSLHLAAESGNENIVKLLLESKASANPKTKTGLTPLYLSIEKDHISIINLLLEKKADVNLSNSVGNTALHAAVLKKSLKTVQLLLEKNANVNVQNEDLNTPLHCALLPERNEFFYWYNPTINFPAQVISGRSEIVNLLIKHEIDFNLQNKDKKSTLHLILDYSAKSRSSEEQSLMCPNWEHCEPTLILLNFVKKFIEGGANVNILDAFGNTPLHILTSNEITNEISLEIAKLLIMAGANVNAKNNYGHTPIDNIMRRNGAFYWDYMVPFQYNGKPHNLSSKWAMGQKYNSIYDVNPRKLLSEANERRNVLLNYLFDRGSEFHFSEEEKRIANTISEKIQGFYNDYFNNLFDIGIFCLEKFQELDYLRYVVNIEFTNRIVELINASKTKEEKILLHKSYEENIDFSKQIKIEIDNFKENLSYNVKVGLIICLKFSIGHLDGLLFFLSYVLPECSAYLKPRMKKATISIVVLEEENEKLKEQLREVRLERDLLLEKNKFWKNISHRLIVEKNVDINFFENEIGTFITPDIIKTNELNLEDVKMRRNNNEKIEIESGHAQTVASSRSNFGDHATIIQAGTVYYGHSQQAWHDNPPLQRQQKSADRDPRLTIFSEYQCINGNKPNINWFFKQTAPNFLFPDGVVNCQGIDFILSTQNGHRDLSGSDFSEGYFKKAKFINCNLTNVCFVLTHLEMANFQGSIGLQSQQLSYALFICLLSVEAETYKEVLILKERHQKKGREIFVNGINSLNEYSSKLDTSEEDIVCVHHFFEIFKENFRNNFKNRSERLNTAFEETLNIKRLS